MTVENISPWWFSPLLLLAGVGLRWVAITICEHFAARAEADNVDDWQDLFWPRMLKRISSKQCNHVINNKFQEAKNGQSLQDD